jgi:hypothetical protein
VIQQGTRYRDAETGAIVTVIEIKSAGVILSIEHDDPRRAGGQMLEVGQVEAMIRERRLVRLWDF